MGFRQPDLDEAYRSIRRCMAEIRSPYNDGWTSSGCKQDLYLLKSWLEEEYQQLPRFADEDHWEQERMWDRLKDRK